MFCVGQVMQAINLRRTVFDAWFITLQHHFHGAYTLNSIELSCIGSSKVEMSS